MPLYWGNNAQGTTPTLGVVPTWCNQTTATGQYLTSSLFQGMTNQTQLCTQATTNFYGLTDPGHTHTYWGDDVNSAQYYALAQGRAVICRERIEAERLARAEAQALQALRMREQQERHEAALARSRELLLENLSPEQRRTFEANNWFIVQGGKTKQPYRIRTTSYAGNIDELKGDKVIARLCVHCDGVPLHDHHLAQKLMLEYDEERVLKVANRTRVA